MFLKYTDTNLLTHLLAKDQQAFSCLFDRYAPVLNGVIQTTIKDPKLAETVLGKAFKEIWRLIADFEGTRDTLFCWMMGITKQVIKEHTKSHPLHRQFSPPLTFDSYTIVSLAYFNNYTRDELSKLTNQPDSVIKKDIRQAMFLLREQAGEMCVS